ncbi:MAG: hypothetical protein ACR2NT_00325 [Acidimicrobiia bacterium]
MATLGIRIFDGSGSICRGFHQASRPDERACSTEGTDPRLEGGVAEDAAVGVGLAGPSPRVMFRP